MPLPSSLFVRRRAPARYTGGVKPKWLEAGNALCCGDQGAPHSASIPGLFPRAVSDAGIPAVECEIGGGGLVDDVYRDVARNSIFGLMKHLRMLPDPARLHQDATICSSRDVVATAGGMLHHAAGLGARVVRAEDGGVITNLHGCVRERLVAPADGVIIAWRRFISVGPGDLALRILSNGA